MCVTLVQGSSEQGEICRRRVDAQGTCQFPNHEGGEPEGEAADQTQRQEQP